MLECYVGSEKDYWWIATQVQAARMNGLLPKTIVALYRDRIAHQKLLAEEDAQRFATIPRTDSGS